jgi:hypothetical protein
MSATKNKGTIASLPLQVRERINTDLLANMTYGAIADWLLSEKHVKGTRHNIEVKLCNWYKGPFLAWRTEQLERDNLVRLVDNLTAQVGATGGDVALLKSMMLESAITIRSSDADVADKANAFAQISREISRHRRDDNAARRLELLEKREADAGNVIKDESLTPEQRERKLKDIFGIA